MELEGSEQGHKDRQVQDTGLKRPVVQHRDVDIEGEAKTKTYSV